MRIYHLRREQFLPVSIDKAWGFFSSPGNLSDITPPGMGFTILSQFTGEPIHTGMKIDYIVKPLLNIPLKWTTEITWVMEPYTFIDKQAKGPYALWEHTHTFSEVPGGVRMVDEVLYAMPLGILGRLVHFLVVNKKLKDIFDFRRDKLLQLFGKFK